MNSLTSLFGNNVSKNKNGANVAVVKNAMVANVAVKNGAMKNKKKNSVEVVNAMVMENIKNGAMKNNNKNNVMNVAETKVVENVKNQMGGVAPVNFRYPANMQQPSEAVMNWATTAGADMPPANEMRNVAHGGARKTRKHKKAKSHKKGKKGNKKGKKSLKRK